MNYRQLIKKQILISFIFQCASCNYFNKKTNNDTSPTPENAITPLPTATILPPLQPTIGLTPGLTDSDNAFIGLAGNCISSRATAKEFVENEKLLNSIVEIIARPQEDRASRLKNSALNNLWNCK